MATFSIENFGCRATDADAAAMRRDLLREGWTHADRHASADFVVLNTCTVTAAADSQAREAVRKIHRANPAARIVVTGCYAQRAPEELAALEGISWVVGNSHQTEIPGLFAELLAPGSRAATDTCSIRSCVHPKISFRSQASISDAMSLARGPAKILTGDIFAQTAAADCAVEAPLRTIARGRS